MDITDLIRLASQNPQIIKQISSQFGLNEQQTSNATNMIMQALAGGIQHNMQQPEGPENLMDALKTGHHEKYVENPENLENAKEEGNAILGHILGSKDVSRNVAAQVGQRTNIQTDLVKQMLPVIASAAMGMLSKSLMQSNSNLNNPNGRNSNILPFLNSMFDTNQNGTAMDEIMQMVMNSRR